MIYGIIPVGGQGTRLNLAFDKELFPLKGYDYYRPVIQHTVDNMISAGVERIYFIHGKEYKQDIVDRFNYWKGETDKVGYFHILNQGNQANIFNSFHKAIVPKEDDIYLYGLPDSYYKINPFDITKNGLQISMMQVDNDAKVGRINIKTSLFDKDIKKELTTDHCWTTLQFDYSHFNAFIKELNINTSVEVESVLNQLNFNLNYYDCLYYDLGTWKSINEYWNKNSF
jgi:hypothetical protein